MDWSHARTHTHTRVHTHTYTHTTLYVDKPSWVSYLKLLRSLWLAEGFIWPDTIVSGLLGKEAQGGGGAGEGGGAGVGGGGTAGVGGASSRSWRRSNELLFILT